MTGCLISSMNTRKLGRLQSVTFVASVCQSFLTLFYDTDTVGFHGGPQPPKSARSRVFRISVGHNSKYLYAFMVSV